MKKILYKIFYPNKFIAIPLCLFSTVLLIYVFSVHLEDQFISYIAYLLSAYSLVLFLIWFCKACKFSGEFIKKQESINYMKNILDSF